MAEDIIAEYQREQEFLDAFRRESPELLTPRQRFSPTQLLHHIGILVDVGPLPHGYLNLYPRDFIVEEVGTDDKISTIEPGDAQSVPSPEGQLTLYADLVKVGLSTLEACHSVAQALGLADRHISYAGLKDKIAITSQRIAIRRPDPEKVAGLSVPAVHLKNWVWGKGVLRKGGLRANRFTILVRTPATLGKGWLEQQLKRWQAGFYNFYYMQRFGTPRLLSHHLGKLLLRGASPRWCTISAALAGCKMCRSTTSCDSRLPGVSAIGRRCARSSINSPTPSDWSGSWLPTCKHMPVTTGENCSTTMIKRRSGCTPMRVFSSTCIFHRS